jgi:hypothetical protein
MEGKTKTKTMGWVERFGENYVFQYVLPSLSQNISKPHNPINS